MSTIIEELKAAFKEENPAKCVELTKKALSENIDPMELINKVVEFVKELTEKSWWSGGAEGQGADESEALLLSDLIVIGECLKSSTNEIKPKLLALGKKSENNGKIVIGTIEGDTHDIGKSIVTTLWEAAGFVVKDIGIDVPPKTFALEAKLFKADIVGVSLSIGMCKSNLPKVVSELKRTGLYGKVKIMDGGQCAFPTDVEKYGIDAHGLDANDALVKADELMRILKEKRSSEVK